MQLEQHQKHGIHNGGGEAEINNWKVNIRCSVCVILLQRLLEATIRLTAWYIIRRKEVSTTCGDCIWRINYRSCALNVSLPTYSGWLFPSSCADGSGCANAVTIPYYDCGDVQTNMCATHRQ